MATYNIHKGVRGVGPRKRLEIHNLVLGVEALDADFVFLQEVRRMNRAAARHFHRHQDRLAGACRRPTTSRPKATTSPTAPTRSTRHGEHGNALLSRWPIGDIGHHDVSDHRFEQRGLLHVPVTWNGTRGARDRRALRPDPREPRAPGRSGSAQFIAAEVPAGEPLIVAGDFNDWGEQARRARCATLRPARAAGPPATAPARVNTFPSRAAACSALDRIYMRGFRCRRRSVPRGVGWARMSDHLPLVAELELA